MSQTEKNLKEVLRANPRPTGRSALPPRTRKVFLGRAVARAAAEAGRFTPTATVALGIRGTRENLEEATKRTNSRYPG